jgi:glycosyltransferase involved in cell wall biosynthesis
VKPTDSKHVEIAVGFTHPTEEKAYGQAEGGVGPPEADAPNTGERQVATMRRQRNISADTDLGRSRQVELNGQGNPAVLASGDDAELPPQYLEARQFAESGEYKAAREGYARLLRQRRRGKKHARLRGLIHNDLAVLDAIEGRFEEARESWKRASEADGDLLLARLNRDLFEAEMSLAEVQEETDVLKLVPSPGNCRPVLARIRRRRTRPPDCAPTERLPRSARVSDPAVRMTDGLHQDNRRGSDGPVRIAILSFLFNWPSTGGGNMHTAGLVEFLRRAGYEVRHFFARFPAWRIGRVSEDGLVASQALEFDDASWNVAGIRARYRRAVDEFQPDYVAITDAWNMKPHLAEAMRGYPTFLLFQAQECLCPLNNLRLLGIGPHQVEQCPRNQLSTPQVCHGCLAQRGQHSGTLHQVERALAGVGTVEYDQKLRRSLLEAEAVLALNPLTAAMLEPYARRVCVVPYGIDAARFPWPADVRWVKPTDSDADTKTGGFHPPYDKDGERRPAVAEEGGVGLPEADAPKGDNNLSRSERRRLFMAAVAGETIKGFHVAHEACRLLWQTRHDFELIVTFDPPGQIDEFTRAIGWQSQAELPRQYRQADICLVPTIAQDGLSITSVEAMASGIPVIASRIGGVPFTVTDRVTGLLCEPGDAADLASKIARLLDDPELRHKMGLAGRRRFEADFTWETVIERYWRPLLTGRAVTTDA